MLRPGAPPLRDGFSLSQASSQQQVRGVGRLWGAATSPLPRGSEMQSNGAARIRGTPHRGDSPLRLHPPARPQLVGRAVEALLNSGQQKRGGLEGGGNVLCYGFRLKRPTGGQRAR